MASTTSQRLWHGARGDIAGGIELPVATDPAGGSLLCSVAVEEHVVEDLAGIARGHGLVFELVDRGSGPQCRSRFYALHPQAALFTTTSSGAGAAAATGTAPGIWSLAIPPSRAPAPARRTTQAASRLPAVRRGRGMSRGIVMYVATSVGRCRPCHRRYVWPAAVARLGEMRCPRCQRPLSRASQLGNDTTVTLSATDVREMVAAGGSAAAIPLNRPQATPS